MKRTNTNLILASVACAALALMSCSHPTQSTGNGSGVGNGVAAMLYNPGGSPAANAKVRFYPIHYNPRTGNLTKTIVAIVDSTTTDASGNYTAKLDTGTYNVLAAGDSGVVYQDSITVVKDSTIHPPADTLKAPGSIRGVVRLQPGDDARTVFIIFMGTNILNMPDDAIGNFTAANMAEGTYRVRILTTLDAYVPKDTVLSVTAGKVDSLTHDIVLQYTGIPVPSGLAISYDTLKQIVTLTWNKPTTGRTVQSYTVYRKRSDSTSFVPLKSGVADTIFNDSTGVQDQTYEYRVAAVDSNNTPGVMSAGMVVKVVSGFVLIDSVGSGTGELSSFALSSNENIYLLNKANDTVYKYDNSKNLKLTLGGVGSDLEDIVIDKYNNIYIVDAGNNAVQKFDSTGGFVTKWGTLGIGQGQFDYPYRIAIRDSVIYVAQWNNPRIQKFTLNGTYLQQIGSAGSGNGQFTSSIKGIDMDSAGNIYVFDGYKLQKFSEAGTFIITLFELTYNEQQSFQGNSLHIFNNQIYITTLYAKVSCYDLSGNLISKMDVRSLPQNPNSIQIRGQKMYISTFSPYVYIFQKR